MGLVHTTVTLSNPRFPELESVTASALVDTGAVHLCIPEHLAVQLNLEQYDRKEVTVADGRRQIVPYMGPVQLKFKNRTGLFGALVFGDEVLMGAIPMEDLDLVVCPKDRRVDVNPENPNFAYSTVK